MCKLCDALVNEKNKYLYEDDFSVILQTKNMKGHHKRIMILTKKHISYDDISYPLKRICLDTLVNFSKKYFGNEPTFALVEPTYCTIPEHWHYIACDWFGTKKETKQLHYTPHVAVKTYMKWKP